MNRTDALLAALPSDEARIAVDTAAARYANMVGGRLCDAVAMELRHYERLGHDTYIARVEAKGRQMRATSPWYQ